ncbi:DMT family transporter [Bacillus infantis]|uniref:DMT family transporter n=1 Tax=Bacillus infantis TaxID=324767 RepID=UPI001CD3ECA4|nr:DMT family transporter [Bacillus infantis]MCA1041012.1 DMT family transporter [Bacillus infantis]
MGKLYSALIGLSLIWGTSFLFIKILLHDLGPEAVVFGRCLFGAAVLWGISFIKREKIQWKRLPFRMLFLVGLINNALPWYFISKSETAISSSMASVINATTPIWTIIIGWLFFGSKLRKSQWAGILIGFFGIFILSGFRTGDLAEGNTAGIVFMSMAAFCYGLGTHLSKKHLEGVSVLQISLFTLTSAALASGLYTGIASPSAIPLLFAPERLGSLFVLGALGSGAAYLLYYFLVQKGSPEFASLVTYIVPVSAIAWGYFLLGEHIKPGMAVGLAVIFLGIYISSYKVKREKKRDLAA